MKRLLALLFVGLGLLIGLALLLRPGEPDYVEQSIRLYDLERQQQDDQATAKARHIGTALWELTPPVLLIGGLSFLAWQFAADRRRRRELLQPDQNGLYPIDTGQLSTDIAQQVALMLAGGAMQSAVERAKVSGAVPHTYTYAPRITGGRDAAAAPMPLLIEDSTSTPALPDTISLTETLPQVPRGHLAYGVLPGGELLTAPLGKGYHGLYHGDTRSGKTNAIDGMIVQLHHMAARGMAIALYAGDFKRELAATWSRSALFRQGIATESADIAEMLQHLVAGEDGILERYRTFAHLGEQTGRVIRNMGDYANATGERPRLVVCFVDELNAVLELPQARQQLAPILKQLLQMGAGAGIYLMGGAQYLSAATFGRDGSKQFVTRAHFGAYDQVAARMLFGSAIDEESRVLVTGQPGRGLIRTVQQASPQPFQAFRCDEEDILDAIKLHERTGVTTPAESATTHQQPVKDLERPFTGVSPSESHESLSAPLEVALVIHRLRAEGKGKAAIIELLWGAKPGGSKIYQEAAKLYDQLASQAG
jgi:DNA segregation ATPase FtsK/SpoIIIE-like protein